MINVFQRIGNAKYITMFDGLSNFWTVPLTKEICLLAPFVSDAGQFE